MYQREKTILCKKTRPCSFHSSRKAQSSSFTDLLVFLIQWLHDGDNIRTSCIALLFLAPKREIFQAVELHVVLQVLRTCY